MSRLRWNAGQIVQDNEDIGIEGVDYFKRSSAYYTEDFVKILYNEIKDYKSRIEKAVEYITNTEDMCYYGKCNDGDLLIEVEEDFKKDLLNILNGRSDE